MNNWRHEEGNWEKYWKKSWDKKWGEEGQKYAEKYQEMGKIMNKLGETQFKTAKLIMELATKKTDAEYKRETRYIEKIVEELNECFDKKYNELR